MQNSIEIINNYLYLLAESKHGLKIFELKQILNIDKTTFMEMTKFLQNKELIISEFGETYKITMEGRLYLESLTTSLNASLNIKKSLQSPIENKRTSTKQIKKSVVKIVLEMAENIIAKILSEKFFK